MWTFVISSDIIIRITSLYLRTDLKEQKKGLPGWHINTHPSLASKYTCMIYVSKFQNKIYICRDMWVYAYDFMWRYFYDFMWSFNRHENSSSNETINKSWIMKRCIEQGRWYFTLGASLRRKNKANKDRTLAETPAEHKPKTPSLTSLQPTNKHPIRTRT